MIVAIDGPAGAGKSTIAQRVAERLGFQLLDTGAIYRTVAWIAHQQGVDWSEARSLAAIASGLRIRFEMRDGVNTVLLAVPSAEGAEEKDVTRAIRAPEMGRGASQVSAHPEVRDALMELQRRIGAARDSVVEGRDIGTVVFPAAEAKIYLTASVEERARRRREQLLEGTDDAAQIPPMAEIEAEIIERDHRDMTRAVAPLRQADDATLVDCTDMTQDEVIEHMLALVEAARA